MRSHGPQAPKGHCFLPETAHALVKQPLPVPVGQKVFPLVTEESMKG